MARVEVSPEFIVKAMQSAPVRAGLNARAQRASRSARALADAEGVDVQTPYVEDGTRPRGRPYSAVVIADGAAQEWGTSRTERRRILGRAAESS